MLCAKMTLVAGPRHKRFEAGTAVRALVFMKTLQHPNDLNGDDFKALAVRGWKRITLQGHKLLADDHKFERPDSEEALAFRAAHLKGIGIVVLGPAT